jgi:protein-L-isoaspartate(D-aspartate) O-methyltransferase
MHDREVFLMDNAIPAAEEQGIVQMRYALVQYLKSYGLVRSASVEAAFQAVPRHLFLPGIDVKRVYSDTAIATKTENGFPISSSSQPAIMACMLEQLDVQSGQHILEIGAGTGYNAALLAFLVGERGSVTTIDIDEDIVMSARKHLSAAGYPQVRVVHSDGGLGYAEQAPYDRIILTVGADDITPAWRQHLIPGGKLVLPFKITQFRSILEFPLALDQVSLALQRIDDHLESYSMYAAGFMPLRGTFAVQQRRSCLLDKGITFASRKAVPDNTVELLQQSYQDLEVSIQTNVYELWGLHIWLILQEPDYCEIQKKDASQQYETLPLLGQQSDGTAASYGLFAQNGLSLLYRQPIDDTELEEPAAIVNSQGEVMEKKIPRWDLPARLVIRSFGYDSELAQHLYQTIHAWDEAGRPFQWNYPMAINNLTIHAYPTETPYAIGPRELISQRKGSRLVFTW